MDDLIRIRSGDLNGRSEMPRLKHAEVIDGIKRGTEIGYFEEEKSLYAGTPEGNIRLCGADDLPYINSKINEILSEISTLTTTIANIESEITNIKSRLSALETPSE